MRTIIAEIIVTDSNEVMEAASQLQDALKDFFYRYGMVRVESVKVEVK